MTTKDFDAVIAEDDASARRQMLDLMQVIFETNEAIKPLEEVRDKARAQLKQLMQLGDLETLDDRERNIVARIQHRNGSPVYDLVSAVKAGHDGALIEAASVGMVRIDHTMLKRFREQSGASWADDLARYEGPGTGSEALYVEALKP